MRRSSGNASSHSAMCSARSRTSALRIDLAEQRWGLAHGDRAWPEWLDDETEPRKLIGLSDEACDIAFLELDDFGDQQDLPRDAGLPERRLQALVDDALVGGMLIDDHQPVAGLRHDIGRVHLRARGTQRSIEQIGDGLGQLDRPCRRRSADVECRLRRLGKSG